MGVRHFAHKRRVSEVMHTAQKGRGRGGAHFDQMSLLESRTIGPSALAIVTGSKVRADPRSGSSKSDEFQIGCHSTHSLS